MSFLNPTPVPVTLYSSADTDAPQLAQNNWTGAIKTILKACLVTGYGSKPGQNWAISDETANKATFTPTDPQAPPVGIIIDSANAQYSRFDLVWQGTQQGIQESVAKITRPITADYTWFLVASPRGFALIINMRFGSYPTASGMLYFGGLQHNLRNPGNQDFVFYNTFSGNWYQFSHLCTNLYDLSTVAWTAGDLKATGNIKDGRGGLLSTAVSGTHRKTNAKRTSTADTETESKLYSEIIVNSAKGLVGKIPGLLVASHRVDGDITGTIINIENSIHRWLYTDQLNSVTADAGCGLLVNTESWTY